MGDQITPYALNPAMAGAAAAPKREQPGHASLRALGILSGPSGEPVAAPGRALDEDPLPQNTSAAVAARLPMTGRSIVVATGRPTA
jgi:hypothetical protein